MNRILIITLLSAVCAAPALAQKNEGAVKVAVHRLRQRFRDVVRDEIARTVAEPAEVDEELRCLMAALSAP